tara:strand:+ start:1026 stop:1670 length:645 start_codon:yes stop_codon:yes gene_type:complete
MKATDILKRIVTELSTTAEAEVKEVNLAQETLENGTVLEADSFEPASEVFIVTDEERIALPVGEYILSDGRVLVIVEEGIIEEVKAGQEVEEPSEAVDEVVEEVVEEELTDEAKEPKKVVESHTVETHFATKEELQAAIAVMMELMTDIKAEFSNDKEAMAQENNDLKELMSTASAAKPINHNPEPSKVQTAKFSSGRRPSAMDRVLARINNTK